MRRHEEQKLIWLAFFFCFMVLPMLLLFGAFPAIFLEEKQGEFRDEYGCVTLREVVDFECTGNISMLYTPDRPTTPAGGHWFRGGATDSGTASECVAVPDTRQVVKPQPGDPPPIMVMTTTGKQPLTS